MTTTFNKIHRLKQQSGWTWDKFLHEIDLLGQGGLDEKTLYGLFRSPHRKPNHHVSKLIQQLHDYYFPDPFPAEINALMRVYNHLVQQNQSPTHEKDIADLEYFLTVQLSREAENADYLRRARLHWLLGHIQFDRIPYLRDNGKAQGLQQTKQHAIFQYTSSVQAIEQHNQQQPQTPVGPHHLYKARHNILACYLNAVPQNQREQDGALLDYLTRSSFISNSKLTLQAEPFQWSIARNGLRFSSLVKNADDVRYFFAAMVTVSDKFLDLNYEPLNFGAIAQGSDFRWAIEHVLKDDYLQSL